MGKPIAPAKGIAFAFPDVCLTPAGPAVAPVPYPNVAAGPMVRSSYHADVQAKDTLGKAAQ